MKEIYRHSFQFLLILGLLTVAVITLIYFKDHTIRFYLSLLAGVFYVLVGTLHHSEEKNLKLNHILEHAAIGLIIFIILASLFR